MAEALADVAERIVDENLAAVGVEKVNEAGPNSTFVDFEASLNGLDWADSDLGEWSPVAVEAKEDSIYRVWFQKR